MELVLAAQFDTGHYRSIELLAGDGRAPFRREADAAGHRGACMVHALVCRCVPSRAVAQVSDGWRDDRAHRTGEPVGLRAATRLWRAGLHAAELLALGGIGRRWLGAHGACVPFAGRWMPPRSRLNALQEGRFVTVARTRCG